MSALKKFRSLFNPIDLTKGRIPKVLLAFMVPIILSMFFQQIYTLTDTMIVGQTLSHSAIVGIGDSSILVYMVLDFAIGCTSGFSVIIAEKIGKKDLAAARKSYFVQLLLSLIISIILTVVGLCSIDFLLSLMNIDKTAGGEMKEIYDAARIYLIIIYSGIAAQMFYNLIVGVLRALGDSFIPFLFLVFSTLLNIALDLLFIIIFKWGVAGSAVATVLSQFIAAIGCFIYAYVRYKEIRLTREDMHVGFSFVMAHLKNGVPLGFQNSILSIGILLMQRAVIFYDINPDLSMVTSLPVEMGYGASSKLIGVLMTPYVALGAGMLAYTGQNLGAKDYDRIEKGFKTSLLFGFVTYLIVLTVGLLLTFWGTYQHLFLAADKISEKSLLYGNSYLYIAIPTTVILMVLFLARNVLLGLEKPLFPFLAGIGELIARSLICLYIPAIVNGGPVDSGASLASYLSVCTADPMAWLAATLIMIIPLAIQLKKVKKAGFSREKSLSNKEVSPIQEETDQGQ